MRVIGNSGEYRKRVILSPVTGLVLWPVETPKYDKFQVTDLKPILNVIGEAVSDTLSMTQPRPEVTNAG